MHSFTTFTALLSLLTSSYAVAVPAASIGRPPIAYSPVPDGFRINSNEPVILPNVTILNIADLLTPGTVVPGSLRPRNSDVEKRDVLGGVDNRFLQVKTGNPWDYIGRISWQYRTPEGVVGTARCSAALVGPRHLATASHCRVNGGVISGTLVSNIIFEPNYDQGPRGFVAAQVTTIIAPPVPKDWGCGAGDDWMVFILNQRLGDRYGHFGVKIDPSKTGSFWHEGYPSDLGGGQRPYAQEQIKKVTANIPDCGGAAYPLFTDADVATGQSGGPLWLLPEADGVRYLYGVVSSGSGAWSAFGGGQAFVNAVANARRDFP